jgi:hypothetical protein
MKDGVEITMYSQDQMVTLALNVDMHGELASDLIAYWGFLVATEKGNGFNCGPDSPSMDIGEFNAKYPGAKWNISTRLLEINRGDSQ